jgi:hypothetical protein
MRARAPESAAGSRSDTPEPSMTSSRPARFRVCSLRPGHSGPGRRVVWTFCEAEPCAVASAAILHGPPQAAVPVQHRSGGARARGVDEDRIAGMRPPRAEETIRHEDRQHVGVRADAVPGRGEHPELAGVAHHRGVARLDAVEQDRFLHPPVREGIGAVEPHGAVLRAFGDHPDLAAVLDQERIGEVPGLLEHREDRSHRSVLAEAHRRDAGLLRAVIEVLDEDRELAVAQDREGIGVEAQAPVGEARPGGAAEALGVPDVAVGDHAPAHPPMGSAAAEVVELAGGLERERSGRVTGDRLAAERTRAGRRGIRHEGGMAQGGG